MIGKDARFSIQLVGRWQAWLAAGAGVAAVAAICIALRGNFGPETASAQATGGRTPVQAAKARPVQAQAAARSTASAPAGPAPGARPVGSASAQPPAATPNQVLAVVNGEQITRAELGRECIRRYG